MESCHHPPPPPTHTQVAEGKSEKLTTQEAGFRNGVMVEKDPEQPLEADINLGPTASRKMGTQSHAHKELNSANTTNELGS